MSGIPELWQLYDKQGRPLIGKGATKDEVFSKGVLHGASHVWIYRQANNKIEILLQKRAATKRTWPNCYDISAAGHIALNEEPLAAAIRETAEEIGYTAKEAELHFIGVQRQHIATLDNQIENEFCWLYLLCLQSEVEFTLTDGEVASLEWKAMDTIKQAVLVSPMPDNYVPHRDGYFRALFEAIEGEIKRVSR